MPNEQITELLDDIDNSLLLNGDDEDCNNNKNKFDSESESVRSTFKNFFIS